LLRLLTHAMCREFLDYAFNAAMLRNQAGNELKQLILSLAASTEGAENTIEESHRFRWLYTGLAA